MTLRKPSATYPKSHFLSNQNGFKKVSAPPVYRPQATASQMKTSGVARAVEHRTAPPVYRPQMASSQMKPVASNPSVVRPSGPPVYRPNAGGASGGVSPFVQRSAPVSISVPQRIGNGHYRIVAGPSVQPAGSVMIHEVDKTSIEVTDLSVTPSFRKQGVGGNLLASALRVGLQSGRTRVVLASQDNGSGRLTHWYKSMGFSPSGRNSRGYVQLEAPISKVLSGVTQARMALPSQPGLPLSQSVSRTRAGQIYPAALRPSGSSNSIQRMQSGGLGLPTGSVDPPIAVVSDEEKRKQVAAALRDATRRDWRKGDDLELAMEVRTYEAELRRIVDDALEAKKYELNQRHKTAWDTLANGLASAVEKNNPGIANAVIAVSGSWHHAPFSSDSPEWQRISTAVPAAIEFLQDIGRNALNVYTGIATVNKGNSSSFDPHWLPDLLGQKKTHDPEDGAMTPFSSAVSKVPTSGLFSGETSFEKGHLRGLLEGSVEHYKRLKGLADTAGHKDISTYYGDRIKRLMGTPWALKALEKD